MTAEQLTALLEWHRMANARCNMLKITDVSILKGIDEFGRVVPNINTGKNEYHGTLFVELFEAGGVFLLDEVDVDWEALAAET